MQSPVSPAKISFEESLGRDVVKSGKCLGCGACTVVCPFGCLQYSEEEPVLVKKCEVCGICPKVCPNYSYQLSELEKFVFGRERTVEEQFGVYRRLAVARAKDEKVREASQDGGVVTSLLLSSLSRGLIDSAILSCISTEKPFCPVPRLVTEPKEILECSGTRYFYSPNLFALIEGARQKKEKIAFVGTPCQVRAVRRMQTAGLRRFIDRMRIAIGLMCSECFTYDGLMEKCIRGRLGLNPRDITKMNIKGKMIITAKSGVQTLPLVEAKQYSRTQCRPCGDFSSELADISVGGLGLEGWTFTVVRSEKGQEMFSSAEEAGAIEVRDAKEEANALGLLTKLSNKKKQSLTV